MPYVRLCQFQVSAGYSTSREAFLATYNVTLPFTIALGGGGGGYGGTGGNGGRYPKIAGNQESSVHLYIRTCLLCPEYNQSSLKVKMLHSSIGLFFIIFQK